MISLHRRAFVRFIAGLGLVLTGPASAMAKAKPKRGEARSASKGKRGRAPQKAREPEGDWQEIWNGVDLSGFVSQLPATAQPASPVFSVVQETGRNLLRISGEVFGALSTTKELSNYRLRLEWKWGVQKFAPRSHLRRSTGLVLHALAARSFGLAKPWSSGIEMELQEGSCGDLWLGEGIRADVPAKRDRFMGQPLYVFAASHAAEPLPQPPAEPRVVKSNDYERGYGEWNVAEAYMFGQEGAFLINGAVTMQFRNLRTVQGQSEVPLTQGPLQLLSEGAEVFIRRIALQPLDKMPDRYRIRQGRS